MLVLDCATPCRFLGGPQSDTKQTYTENKKNIPVAEAKEKPSEDQKESVSAAWCYLCNVEMDQGKSKLRLDECKGSLSKLGDKELPVIVFLCPKCGKIEFKADQ
jgi:hypothetical protein